MNNAELHLAFGDQYPYDQLDGTPGVTTLPANRDRAHRAARGVISDLRGRRDIKRGFENVDEAIRVEIVNTLAEIIELAFSEMAAER